jgi:hypothetical protein
MTDLRNSHDAWNLNIRILFPIQYPRARGHHNARRPHEFRTTTSQKFDDLLNTRGTGTRTRQRQRTGGERSSQRQSPTARRYRNGVASSEPGPIAVDTAQISARDKPSGAHDLDATAALGARAQGVCMGASRGSESVRLKAGERAGRAHSLRRQPLIPNSRTTRTTSRQTRRHLPSRSD